MYLHDFYFLILIHFLQSQSSFTNFPNTNNVDSVSSNEVFETIKTSLNLLCDISSSIPVLNKKTPFLGNNAFIKGAIGLLVHSIVIQSENKAIKWCTKKYYTTEARKLKYNALKDLVLTDHRLDHVRTTLSQVKQFD